jgi:peptidoglycan/LPS O-acetylase OafA/YrhL
MPCDGIANSRRDHMADAKFQERLFPTSHLRDPYLSARGYEPFIDGLRAVSVVLVILFHLDVAAVGGGFVGVDVFFVISGYLIIGQTERSIAKDRFAILPFFGRRIIRIWPNLTIVLVCTAVLTLFIAVGPSQLQEIRKELVSASLFHANHHFLISEGDYFARQLELKPLLHTWSLMVEEQFYVVTPIIIVAVYGLARRMRKSPRAAAGLTGAILALCSFVAAIQFTRPERNIAFFIAPFRAWEFIIGGLIPHALESLPALPRVLRSSLSPVGLVLIVASAVGFDATTPYPSVYAAIPTLGAVLAIAGSQLQARGPIQDLLSHPALVYVGLLSYGWYLWHWPLLSFSRASNYGSASILLDGIAVGLAFALAMATFYWVEQPLRRRRRALLQYPARVVVAAGAIVLLTAGMFQWVLADFEASAVQQKEQLLKRGASTSVIKHICPRAGDNCRAGSEGGSRSLMLIGDSHAASIRPPIARLSDELGIPLVEMIHAACFAAGDVDIFTRGGPRADCRDMWRLLTERIATASPRITSVIVSQNWPIYMGGRDLLGYVRAHSLGTRNGGPATDQAAFMARELDNGLSALERLGVTRILLLGPVPHFRRDPVECVLKVMKLGNPISACEENRDDEFRFFAQVTQILERVTAGHATRRWLDPMPAFCTESRCSVMSSAGQLLYIDRNHISVAGAEHLYGVFSDQIDWALGLENVHR